MGVYARYSPPEEDCGYQKADIIMQNNEREYPIQVSRGMKSKKQQKNLQRRGTFVVHTEDFYGNIQKTQIQNQLETILAS